MSYRVRWVLRSISLYTIYVIVYFTFKVSIVGQLDLALSDCLCFSECRLAQLVEWDNERVGGSNSGSHCPHDEVSLGKTLKPIIGPNGAWQCLAWHQPPIGVQVFGWMKGQSLGALWCLERAAKCSISAVHYQCWVFESLFRNWIGNLCRKIRNSNNVHLSLAILAFRCSCVWKNLLSSVPWCEPCGSSLSAVGVSHTSGCWRLLCRRHGGAASRLGADRQSEAHSRLPAAEVNADVSKTLPPFDCLWSPNSRPCRVDSLQALVQVQQDFEASVRDTLEGISGLWARLEVLHTGVTLTKHWGPGHKDLASAWTDLEVGMFSHQSGGWTSFDLIFICSSPALFVVFLLCVWSRLCPLLWASTQADFRPVRTTWRTARNYCR